MPKGRGLMREKSPGPGRFIFFLHCTSLRSGESVAFSELSGKGIVTSITGTESRASSSTAAPRIFGMCSTAPIAIICLCS